MATLYIMEWQKRQDLLANITSPYADSDPTLLPNGTRLPRPIHLTNATGNDSFLEPLPPQGRVSGVPYSLVPATTRDPPPPPPPPLLDKEDVTEVEAVTALVPLDAGGGEGGDVTERSPSSEEGETPSATVPTAPRESAEQTRESAASSAAAAAAIAVNNNNNNNNSALSAGIGSREATAPDSGKPETTETDVRTTTASEETTTERSAAPAVTALDTDLTPPTLKVTTDRSPTTEVNVTGTAVPEVPEVQEVPAVQVPVQGAEVEGRQEEADMSEQVGRRGVEEAENGVEGPEPVLEEDDPSVEDLASEEATSTTTTTAATTSTTTTTRTTTSGRSSSPVSTPTTTTPSTTNQSTSTTPSSTTSPAPATPEKGDDETTEPATTTVSPQTETETETETETNSLVPPVIGADESCRAGQRRSCEVRFRGLEFGDLWGRGCTERKDTRVLPVPPPP